MAESLMFSIACQDTLSLQFDGLTDRILWPTLLPVSGQSPLEETIQFRGEIACKPRFE
jgi:hypothetical protein